MFKHSPRSLRNAVAAMAVVLPVASVQADEAPVRRIAFGSCIRQNRPQPIWDAVVAHEPQLFLMLGDNVYADSTDPERIRAAYRQLGNEPGFRTLRKRCTVLATWDDHDYGRNDAGAAFPAKRASQRIFLDFFDVPPDSPRRDRRGVYGARTFGPAGRRVQVILLDTRFFRDPLRRHPDGQTRNHGPYRPHETAGPTLLGEAQWRWLETQLRRPARVRLLCSSIQVISDRHGWETWGNFPHERRRLFELIARTKAGGLVILSGDRHFAELSRTDEGPQPLYELTSSSINQPATPLPGERNPHRLAGPFTRSNFGSVTIDWDAPSSPRITLRIHHRAGEPGIEHEVKLTDLQPGRARQ